MRKLKLIKTIIILSLFTLTVDLPAQQISTNRCATFNFPTLQIQCFNLEGSSYWLDLELVSSTLELELKEFGLSGPAGDPSECAAFFFSTYSFHIPCFELNSTNYWLNMDLTGFEPLLFKLKDYGENRSGLSGEWNFFVTFEGSFYEDGPFYMAVNHDITSLTLTAVCDETFPAGAGNVDGTRVYISFDFGDGNTMELSGEAYQTTMTGDLFSFMGSGIWRAQRTGAVDCENACDPVSIPRFVKTDFTDLSMIERISKFRSGIGHDYSDLCESCRSMKHYYAPYNKHKTSNGIIEIYSPVEGTIVKISDEQHGTSAGLENKQVVIIPSIHPEIAFTLFHVDLISSGIIAGKHVTEGEKIGYARLIYPDLGEVADNFDIAVSIRTPYGERIISYFETMEDSLFENYISRGASERTDFIISKDSRDGDPLTCVGEEFTGSGSIENWVILDLP